MPPVVPPAALLVAPAATPPDEPLTDEVPPDPAVVFDVVFVDCVAVVVWLVVALGLIVTLLCGIALKLESVFTLVLAFGLTRCFAFVLVLLRARFVVSPVAPVAPVPACVFDVVLVD